MRESARERSYRWPSAAAAVALWMISDAPSGASSGNRIDFRRFQCVSWVIISRSQFASEVNARKRVGEARSTWAMGGW